MESSSSTNRLVCLVCQKQFSHYTCPRCNVRYCSLPCYRSHSARCLESFNRDNVLAEMRDAVATSDTKKRMMETLKKFYLDGGMEEDLESLSVDHDHEEDDGEGHGHNDSDEKLCVLSESTLSKLASGEEIELNELSEDERKAFSRAVASGEFSHMIKPWDPWWHSPFLKKLSLNKGGNRLVQPLGDKYEIQDNADGVFDVPPPLNITLPQLNQLTSKQPSPLLGVHLVDVLYSYCFTVRLYNGEWTYDAFGAAKTCLSVSPVLRLSSSPETVSEALSNCVEITCSPGFKSIGGYNFVLTLLDDTAALLRAGRCGVICGLSELHRMFEKGVEDGKEGYKNVSKEHESMAPSKFGRAKIRPDSGKGKVSVFSDLRKACKKIFFLLCWSNEQHEDSFSSLSLLVETEKAHIEETHESTVFSLNKKEISHKSHNYQTKALVEEIS